MKKVVVVQRNKLDNSRDFRIARGSKTKQQLKKNEIQGEYNDT